MAPKKVSLGDGSKGRSNAWGVDAPGLSARPSGIAGAAREAAVLRSEERALKNIIRGLESDVDDLLCDMSKLYTLKEKAACEAAVLKEQVLALRSEKQALKDFIRGLVREVDDLLDDMSELYTLKEKAARGVVNSRRSRKDLDLATCPVCLEHAGSGENRLFALVPCGHLLCEACSKKARLTNCPTCRGGIQARIRIFTS